MEGQEITICVSAECQVSALLCSPPNATALFVLGHGSGSNMRVPLMEGLSNALAARGIATLRFQYPYSEHADFIPFTNMPTDSDHVLIETIRAVLKSDTIAEMALPIYVGGHSISALMTIAADSADPLEASAIISLAFPHKGEEQQSEILKASTLPVLMIQGTKDTLGAREEILTLAQNAGGRITAKWIEGASHVFDVDGRHKEAVIGEIADLIAVYIGARKTIISQ